jgi:hypothetical protein
MFVSLCRRISNVWKVAKPLAHAHKHTDTSRQIYIDTAADIHVHRHIAPDIHVYTYTLIQTYPYTLCCY